MRLSQFFFSLLHASIQKLINRYIIYYRGDGIDQGLRQPLFLKCMSNPVTDGSNLPDPSAEFQRSYDDMLIAYSSLPGTKLIFFS